jgi:hypothetical protein
MPDGLWALFGVVVTVVATATMEFLRHRRTRAERQRAERLAAYSALLGAASEFVRTANSVLMFREQGRDSADRRNASRGHEDSLVLVVTELSRAQLVSTSAVSEELSAIMTRFLDAMEMPEAKSQEVRALVGGELNTLRRLLTSQLVRAE